MHLDWRHPAIRAKASIIDLVRGVAAKLGRLDRITASERETRPIEIAPHVGDMPQQHRRIYAAPRPISETARNVVYTNEGVAIVNGRIIERFSIRAPSALELLVPTGAPVERVPQGTIVENQTPCTYGDWVGDFLCALVCADEIVEPLLIPSCLGRKPYVLRDLKRFGADFRIVEATTLIENAKILRKRAPSYDWGRDEVVAYRRAFSIAPPAPRPKSITYLGRFNYPSEVAVRRYPSTETAAIVKAIGGQVFDTRNASPDAFDAIANDAETIIADQGSAIFGVLHWRTKNLIELTTRRWWHNSSLFFARAAGVENYAVIEVDGLSSGELRRRILGHLADFGWRRPESFGDAPFSAEGKRSTQSSAAFPPSLP